MNNVEKIEDGIFRIKVPFEDLFTTVYVVETEQGVLVIDSATYPSDVDRYIVPALDYLGQYERVVCLALTHSHSDHAGGIGRLSEIFPNAQIFAPFKLEGKRITVVEDGQKLCGRIRVISLPGHTKNSCGYYDEQTKTLLSGDCLQLKGVGKYVYGIGYPQEYVHSVERLRKEDINKIVAAHDYDPLGSIANGKTEVERYLKTCIEVM